MLFEDNTATHLGWKDVGEALAAEAETPQGRTLCRSLRPASDPDEIRCGQERYQLLSRLIDSGKLPPELCGIEEIEEDLARATKQGTLSADAILRVARVMLGTSRLRQYLMTAGEAGPLIDLARPSHDLRGAGRDLVEAFDEGGQLRDSASPELGRLRRDARLITDSIRTRLERMIRTKKVAACLQEPYVTLRGDRYVLPVRSDAPEPFPGIVHDTSHSGATLFIEPAALVEDGNRLKIAQAAVAEEERRILSGYTQEIADVAEAVGDNLRMLARFDLVVASEKLGRNLKGRMIPVAGTGFQLLQARHPLMVLSGETVVANDLRLLGGQLSLVVTGPNAGGKTVALKTLGLITLMAHASLPVPVAEGSRLGLFHALHAVIGDAQDLRRGLSTFSAHVASLARILQLADPGTLVLIDEVTADTDPRHGAALACSILVSLAGRGACTVVTTHYEEPKQLPYSDERFANCSVGFDMERMEPTYHLHPDVPGRSLTLDIARRLGVPEEVLSRAALRLDGSERELDRMLQSLDAERTALQELRTELQRRTAAASSQAEELCRAKEELTQTRKEVLASESEQVFAELRQIRREVGGLIDGLRREPSLRSAGQASERLKQLQEQVHQAVEESKREIEPAVPGEPPQLAALRAGDRVLVRHLEREALVTAVDRSSGMVSVRLGTTMQTRVPYEQLVFLSPAPRKAQPRVDAAQDLPRDSERHAEVRTSQNTLDLRGLRVDEAMDEVEKFLDRLFGSGESTAFLIHGHGTGALKASVREYLRDSPYPRHFRTGTPEEGGDGITVVRLK